MGGLRKTMQFSGISEIENRLVVRTESLHELGGLADPPRFRLGKLPIIPFCQHSSEGRVPDVRLAHYATKWLRCRSMSDLEICH
jgi:hypothetical protein